MQWFPLKFIPDHTNFDFIGKRWWGFAASLVLTALAIASFFTHGLNLGIDFTGGVLMEVRAPEKANLHEMREALGAQRFGEVTLQHAGSDRDVLIRIEVDDTAEQSAVVEKVKSVLGNGLEYRKIEYVGPTVGKELVRGSLFAVALAFAGIMAYLWFRFEWQFGLGAIAALAHDALMMVGFFAITGHDFGLNAVAAVLTIIGYSVNDSVVIFDRIRENMRKYHKMSMENLINLSVNETLARSIMTHTTTLLATLALVIFGGEVLRGFSLSLAFGVIVGTYSSIYISAPILMYLNVRRENLQSVKAEE